MKIKIYSFLEKWRYDAEFELRHTTYQPRTIIDRTIIDVGETLVEIPDYDISKVDVVTPQLERLEKMKVAAEVKVAEIEEEMKSLIALEHKHD